MAPALKTSDVTFRWSEGTSILLYSSGGCRHQAFGGPDHQGPGEGLKDENLGRTLGLAWGAYEILGAYMGKLYKFGSRSRTV